MNVQNYVLGAVLIVIGVVCMIYGIKVQPSSQWAFFGGVGLVAFGAAVATGMVKKLGFKVAGVRFEAEFVDRQGPTVERRDLSEEDKAERHDKVRDLAIPGSAAPAFAVSTPTPLTDGLIGEASIVPAYTLDADFRIRDWNDAFSLVFDRTMEGRRGESVLEWIYLLKNYEEVVKHGVEAFKEGAELPRIDVEPIEYDSGLYGPISGTKRAYQIPGDDGSILGWLVAMEVNFTEPAVRARFYLDLLARRRKSMIWSEYALSYDNVLNQTEVYPKLLRTMLGEDGEMGSEYRIPRDAKVLDLGAGTGNLAQMLVDGEQNRRSVCAIENNTTMLNLLRDNCKDSLTRELGRPGIFPIKQDATCLFGLPNEYFEYVLMNNVLYTLDNPDACLEEVHRVLQPGGEVRISGPKKNTKLQRLFKTIRSDLNKAGRWADVRDDYDRVEQINKHLLGKSLFKWDISDVETMLQKTGFSTDGYATSKAYAGQAMIVFARKPTA